MTPRSFHVLAAVALLAPPAEAITRCVKPPPSGGCYSTIQVAVDESGPGDLINVARGVYFENVVIPAGKDGLSIVGAGKLATIIDPDRPLTGNAITVRSNGVKIKNLGIRNGQAHGISIDEPVTGVLIQGLRIVGLRSLFSTGILGFTGIGLGNSGLQVLNNEIRAVGRSGIDVSGDNVVVTGNSVAQAPRGIYVTGPGARVASNKVTLVTDGGIQVTADGSFVSANTVELAIDDGLGVSGQDPTIQANHMINAGEAVFTCTPTCSGGVVSANTSIGSNDVGFFISADGPGFVARGNKVSWSSGPAFHVFQIEATTNVATDVGVFGNLRGSDCFRVNDGPTLLTRNTATRCAGSGFRVSGSNVTLTGNTSNQAGVNGFMVIDDFAADNTLTGNKALSSNAAGFAVIDPALRTTLSGNTASKSRYGFCDDGTSTTLGQNSFGIPPTSSVCDVVE